MKRNLLADAIGIALVLGLTGCGGGGGVTTPAATPPASTPLAVNAPVSVLISDATSDDWATIGVKVLSITLTPQGGGTPVSVYTAPTPAPVVNLVQLDQLSEILGNAQVPVGTYTSATLTVAANPGDLLLMTSANPEPGFAAPPASTIPSSQIQIQGTSGAIGSQTVSVNVDLTTPLVVSSSSSNALDLEFDLGHPAFVVAHVPAGSAVGGTVWAVNFSGPVRHHPIANLADRILRHTYGTVSAVSSDNSGITITKDLPTLPAVSPETAVATSQSLSILADATNGTIFYDVDAKTKSTIDDFSTVAATLDGKYVRVAARYQQNGTLVATRIWASSNFNSVWVSPEGHVLDVDSTGNTITVTSESGKPVVLSVDQNTQFFKRKAGSDASDATAIGTGPGFLTNLVRGFKVHASVVDPLATQLVAQTVEIETATFDGLITAASATGVTYSRSFRNSANDYVVTLPFIASTSANGTDSSGNPIDGFKWWNFAYPTLVTDGAGAISDFVALSTGAVNFGGTLGAIRTYGTTHATWNDTAAPNAWAAPWVVVQPSPLPLSTVTSAYDATTGSFTMTANKGTNPVTVDVSTASGSATLAYQVDRANGVVTISPLDLTTSAGVGTFTTDVAAGAQIRVGGVPQADGTVKAYSVSVLTGDTAAQ